MDKNELRQELRKLRVQSRLTADEVAETLGIPQSTLSNWENGHGLPNPIDFMRLCRLYGVKEIYSAFSEQSPDNQGVTTVNVFGTEQKVLDAYRKADLATKRMIEKMLDIPAEPATTEKNA